MASNIKEAQIKSYSLLSFVWPIPSYSSGTHSSVSSPRELSLTLTHPAVPLFVPPLPVTASSPHKVMASFLPITPNNCKSLDVGDSALSLYTFSTSLNVGHTKPSTMNASADGGLEYC